MNKFLYPLVATAFITITPFLLTFEKGQDIVRGLFDYSVFALLLFFVYVKNSKIHWKIGLQVLIGFAVFLIGVVDLQNILSYKDGVLGWKIGIPVVTTVLALAMLKNVASLSLNSISFVLFLSLGIHITVSNFFPSQPLFEAPLIKSLSRLDKENVNRNRLPEEVYTAHVITDSAFVTRDYIDTNRNNVIVLVESWGIPIESNVFESELNAFREQMKISGIHHRMYSRTRTAEREDLLDSLWRKDDGSRDSVFIPQKLAALGYKSFFLYGGDSTVLHRDKYVRRLGFDDVVFAQELISDREMTLKIDSLLNDSTQKSFIAWTTKDTQFPMGDDAVFVEKNYFEKMHNTLKIIADLAARHPETRFIVQGDHEPILSPREFREKFYRRWVPFVVLN